MMSGADEENREGERRQWQTAENKFTLWVSEIGKKLYTSTDLLEFWD